MRVTNEGATTLRSEGCERDQIELAYAASRYRLPWQRGQSSTKLLIDLPPGHAITQPVMMLAPEQPGKWRYNDCIEPAVRRVGSALRNCGYKSRLYRNRRPTRSCRIGPGATRTEGYAEDHLHATELLNDWLEHRFAGRPKPRLLELGGNAAPMLASANFRFRRCRVLQCGRRSVRIGVRHRAAAARRRSACPGSAWPTACDCLLPTIPWTR